jgi:exopolysaccharide production protein ExoZ
VALHDYAKVPADPLDAAAWLLTNFLLLAAPTGHQPIITVSWTLSYVMATYFAVPGIARALRGRSLPVRVAACAALWSAGAIAGLAWQPASAACTFAEGMFLCELSRLKGFQRLVARLGEAGAIGSLAAGVAVAMLINGKAITVEQHAGGALSSLALAVGICVFTAYRFTHEGPLNRILMGRAANWLGNINYSYYLTHGPAIAVSAWAYHAMLRPSGPSSWGVWCALPLCYAFSLILAKACHWAVEAPLSRLARSWPPGAQAPAEPVPEVRALAAAAGRSRNAARIATAH